MGETLASYHPANFSGDIGLALLDSLEPAEAAALLVQRRGLSVEALAAVPATPVHSGSWQWVIEHRARPLQAELDWLEEV